MKNRRVAVIGGGLGALSSAIRLAQLGFSVQLFEKNPKIGGKVNEVVPIHEFRKLMRPRHFRTLFRLHQIDPFRTVHERVSRFFSDPRLVQLFDRYATYNGSDPFQAPATLNIIPYVEYGLGGFYIKGGIYRLVDALESVARERGVQIQTSAKVERVCRVGQRVNGVQVNGETIDADYVLCGADAISAHHELIRTDDDIRPRLFGLQTGLFRRVLPKIAVHAYFAQLIYFGLVVLKNL